MENTKWDSGKKPKIVNLGIEVFYQALLSQKADCVQIAWQPPPERSEEIDNLLNQYL